MLVLSPQRRQLVALLSTGKPIPTAAIDKALYSDRADGGPEAPHRCIHAQISRLRDILEPLGIDILHVKIATNVGYLIDPDHQAALNALLAEADAQALAAARAKIMLRRRAPVNVAATVEQLLP